MKVIKSPVVYEAEMFHSKGNIPKCVKCQYGNYYCKNELGGIDHVADGDWIVTDQYGNSRAYSEEEFREIFQEAYPEEID